MLEFGRTSTGIGLTCTYNFYTLLGNDDVRDEVPGLFPPSIINLVLLFSAFDLPWQNKVLGQTRPSGVLYKVLQPDSTHQLSR